MTTGPQRINFCEIKMSSVGAGNPTLHLLFALEAFQGLWAKCDAMQTRKYVFGLRFPKHICRLPRILMTTLTTTLPPIHTPAK